MLIYDGGKNREMMSLRDKDTSPYIAKQEEGDSTKAAASSSSRQWSGFKNPRIVRVSRTFGGKDRHSKVCTIKGLRDRRIRLSVSTAIQLYDLQDRLGLSQPSKVIDWLLDTTKHDIDKLPPLPIVPGCNFTPFHQPSQGYGDLQFSSTKLFDPNLMQSRKQGININSQIVDVDEDDQSLVAKLKYWDQNAMMRAKQKGVDHDQGAIGDHSNASQVSAQNFFPIASGNTSTILNPPPTLLNNNNNHNPMSNYYNWEPSNLSLTQFGNHNSNSSPLPSSLSLSSGSQLFLYPSMVTTSHFPPHASLMNSTHDHHHQVENELRQFNRSHLLNSISSSLHNSTGLGLKPFPLSTNHDDENHQDKNDHGS